MNTESRNVSGNKDVNTNKKHGMPKKNQILIGGAALTAMVLICCFFVFVVQDITVTGLKYANADEIIRMSGIEIEDSMVFINTRRIEKSLPVAVPNVRSVKIKRHFFSRTLEIAVNDEAASFAIVNPDGTYINISENGKVLGKDDAYPANKAIVITTPLYGVLCDEGSVISVDLNFDRKASLPENSFLCDDKGDNLRLLIKDLGELRTAFDGLNGYTVTEISLEQFPEFEFSIGENYSVSFGRVDEENIPLENKIIAINNAIAGAESDSEYFIEFDEAGKCLVGKADEGQYAPEGTDNPDGADEPYNDGEDNEDFDEDFEDDFDE